MPVFRAAYLAILVVVGGVALRFAFLSADPAYYAWAGYIADEGRWTQQAREIVLFGSLDLRYWLSIVHLALAPLFQAAAWVSFSLFGVGFVSARLVSAVCGGLLIVFLWWHLKSRLSPSALLVAVTAVALQPDLIVLSRVAVPEMATMLFELLAFAVLVSAPRSTGRAAVGGLLMAIALGFKGTGFPLVVIFAAMIAVTHEKDDPSSRSARIAAFVGVIVACAAAVLLLAVAAGPGQADTILAAGPSLSRFTRLTEPYRLATFLFYGDHTTSLNVLLLGAWILAGLLFALNGSTAGETGVLYRASAVWAVAWVGLAAALDYFPERYVFHALVPLGINLGAGLTLLLRHDGEEILRALERVGARRRIFVACWLSLPVGVLLTPLTSGLLHLVGLEVVRFSSRVALIGLLVALSTGIVLRAWSGRRVLGALCVFPCALTVLWFFAGELAVTSGGFWPEPGDPDTVAWLVMILLAAGAAGAVTSREVRWPGVPGPELLIAASLAAIGLVRAAPDIVRPTYTLATAAEAIERELGGRELVWTHRASSVFLPTRLKYREVDAEVPEVIVSMYMLPMVAAEYDYEVQEAYEIRFGEAYHAHHPGADPYLRIMRKIE